MRMHQLGSMPGPMSERSKATWLPERHQAPTQILNLAAGLLLGPDSYPPVVWMRTHTCFSCRRFRLLVSIFTFGFWIFNFQFRWRGYLKRGRGWGRNYISAFNFQFSNLALSFFDFRFFDFWWFRFSIFNFSTFQFPPYCVVFSIFNFRFQFSKLRRLNLSPLRTWGAEKIHK